MDTDAINAALDDIERVVVDGDMRPEAREKAGEQLAALAAEFTRLTARIAELEARQWQPAKWEDLHAGQGVLVWKYGLWQAGRYDATYDEVDLGEGFTASDREPLLAMPPAPDGDA